MVADAPKVDSQQIFSFHLGKNIPERKDGIMENLVVPAKVTIHSYCITPLLLLCRCAIVRNTMTTFTRLFASAVALYCVCSSIRAAGLPLVNHGDLWRYRKGTNAVQVDWKTATDAGLDASWLTGNGAFGYADNVTETQLCVTILGDMRNLYTTVFMRKAFTVSSAR